MQNRSNIDEIGRNPFNIQKIKFSSTPTNYVNFPVKISGKKLLIFRNQTGSKAGDGNLGIKFNSQHGRSIPILTKTLFVTPFNKIYLEGTAVEGTDSDDDLVLIAFENQNDVIEIPDFVGQRTDDFGSGTAQAAKGQVIGVLITSFGNLDVTDYKGQVRDFDNLLPGQFYPISFSSIRSTTTANGIIFYAY